MSGVPDEGTTRTDGAAPAGWTLLVESSTAHGSVALFRGPALAAERSAQLRARDVERLMPAVRDVLADAGVSVGELARVACGAGPGSFTGLRIGAAITKGLAQVAGVPLHGVPSLLLLGAEAAGRFGAGRYLASLDALRAERYVLLVEADASGRCAPLGEVQLLPADAVPPLAKARAARVVSPEHDAVWPQARALAACWPGLGAPLDLAAWEPAYGRLAEAQVQWERAHGRSLAGA